jgi:hypothetical protein
LRTLLKGENRLFAVLRATGERSLYPTHTHRFFLGKREREREREREELPTLVVASNLTH